MTSTIGERLAASAGWLDGIAEQLQPLVQRVQRKRRMFDGMYRARNERLLDLLERFGGVELGDLRRTETVWPSGRRPGG